MTHADFVCDRCGHCCKTLRVPLTISDLKTMLAAWGQQRVEECMELLRSDQVDMTGEPESMALLRKGRHLLVLKHQRQGNTAQCVFLSESGSCTIHALRPSPCRAYPYDRPSGREDQALGLHPTLLCPPETGVHSLVGLGKSASQPVQKAEETVARRDDATKDHATWITHWNRKQRTRLLLGRVPLDAVHFIQALLSEAKAALPSARPDAARVGTHSTKDRKARSTAET